VRRGPVFALAGTFFLLDLHPVAAQDSQAASVQPQWHFGGFLDGAYLYDFNSPSNHVFRDRGTTAYVDELDLDMAAAYLRKDVSEQSRWGMELTVQGGKDSEAFGFSATAPNLAGARWLRHLGPANLSYLAPLGKGLKIQAGIFSSLIGYDSLYAKDNFNYTRPWGADYTPYLMLGVNASYAFNDKLSAALYVVNGYFHLANANHVPSTGGQIAYQASRRVDLKETVIYGPHQSNTGLPYWRFFSDSIVERKTDRVTTALEFQVGAERVAISGSPRAWWMSSQLPIHAVVHGPWSVTVRPEFCWDTEGRWTGSKQLVKAITSTLEYRLPYRHFNAILRLEHRYDNSHGPGGGFFKDGAVAPGEIALTPGQHLVLVGAIFTFDSSW
jgi:hypothetical protein